MAEIDLEETAESALFELSEIESIAIRFAGDSGDGSQLIGNEFANTSAIVGNDISTLPDFPAEIRAPAGTLPGVSGFQIHISSEDIYTPGDEPQVLVAMNPAALKANVNDLPDGGIIIANTDNFTRNNLRKAGYDGDPLEGNGLSNYRVVKVPLTTLHKEAVAHVEGLSNRQIDMMKNFFALGLSYWIFDRPIEPTIRMLEKKFQGKDEIIDGNVSTLKAGYNFGETVEEFQVQYQVKKAVVAPGTYRAVTGTQATAIGMVTAAHKAGKTLFYGSYPITPASAVLEELAALKNFDVRTFQAEDEISALGLGHWRFFRRRVCRHGHQWPRHRTEKRSHEPRPDDGIAPRYLRLSARRPQHGHAHQNRAIGPAPMHVWSQWRQSHPHCFTGHAFRLL